MHTAVHDSKLKSSVFMLFKRKILPSPIDMMLYMKKIDLSIRCIANVSVFTKKHSKLAIKKIKIDPWITNLNPHLRPLHDNYPFLVAPKEYYLVEEKKYIVQNIPPPQKKKYSKIKKNNNKNNRIILFKQDFVAYFYITTEIFQSYSFHVVYEVKFVCMPWNLKSSFRTSRPIDLCLFEIAVCKKKTLQSLFNLSFFCLS